MTTQVKSNNLNFLIYLTFNKYTFIYIHLYCKDNYRLITVDLSKQKALDAHPRAIQQILFKRVVGGADIK